MTGRMLLDKLTLRHGTPPVEPDKAAEWTADVIGLIGPIDEATAQCAADMIARAHKRFPAIADILAAVKGARDATRPPAAPATHAEGSRYAPDQLSRARRWMATSEQGQRSLTGGWFRGLYALICQQCALGAADLGVSDVDEAYLSKGRRSFCVELDLEVVFGGREHGEWMARRIEEWRRQAA